MIETKLKWHYFKDELPSRHKYCLIQLGKGHSVCDVGTVRLAKFLDTHTDEEILDSYKNDIWAYVETPRAKEFHVWLDTLKIPSIEEEVYISYEGTKLALEYKENVINTTQASFLKTSILDDYRLFVHKDGKQIEITLGDCQGTDRYIKAGHNLEKLVLGGEFSFD